MAPTRAPCLLALDSATERLAVAVVAGDRQWCAEEEGGARASQRALPLAFELLARAGLEARALDAVKRLDIPHLESEEDYNDEVVH